MPETSEQRLAREMALEELAGKLLETGQCALPSAGLTHNVALAGWLGATPRAVREQIFHRTDGHSAPALRCCKRDLTTLGLLTRWVEGELGGEGGVLVGAPSPRPTKPTRRKAK